MWPNVEFRDELPKTNPGLTKSHLQRKTRGYAQKSTPDRGFGGYFAHLRDFGHFGGF